ncbi:ferritin-like domain-containing protein [Spirosoma koreense]
MEKLPNDSTEISQLLTGRESAAIGRRIFMRYLGTTAAAGVALSACHSQINDVAPVGKGSARAGFNTVDLGDLETTDRGILNYAYALEQLEAAFYTMVVMNPYKGISDMEMRILKDIKDHEVAHRELFKVALGSGAIPGLTPDFSSIDFSSRMSVLATAKTFENVGVSAYNGAGKFIKSPDYLTLAGKIVSVEARHASVIAAIIDPNTTSFAPDALDPVMSFRQVLTTVAPYIKETVNFNAA